MDYFAICAIVRDEENYLDEWVRYHRAVGVERFHIFDNQSKVPVVETLKEFVDSGLVKVTPVQGFPVQLPVYSHFIKEEKSAAKWVAFIDVDEFIVPVRHADVKHFIRPYERFAGVGVNWMTYGSSGHRTPPKGLVIENYLRRADKSAPENQHIKSIVQPEFVEDAEYTPHHFRYKAGWHAVNEQGEKIEEFSHPHSSELIQLNHYFHKSLEDFQNKLKRRRADGGPDYSMQLFEEREPSFNAIEDRTILRFVPRMKK